MSTKKVLDLLAFVRQLPSGVAYAPIYAKDQPIQSGKLSKGKTPLEKSHHQVMGPADVALQIERKPEVFQAVGAFTGARSGGLVILDVDRNLARLKKKWGDSLEGAPVVTSTKQNAAKYLFRVPEALWASVKGFGLSDTGAGYEVLWGRQGVLYGAYPGSSDGKAPAGEYGFEGDLEAIPEAPDWLIAEMRDHAGKELSDGGFIKNRKALDFSDRDPAEVAEIIQSALKVIPGQGAGSRDHWVKVGMAIHSELPTDLGLTLWSAWSAEDPEFSQDWSQGNPCEQVWQSFRKGPVSLGTLFWMADQQMPGRLWLSEELRRVVEDAEASPLRYRQDYLDGQALIDKALKLEETLENPALLDQAKHILGLEAGRRDGSISVDRMLDAHLSYERTKGSGPQPLESLKSEAFDYLIPGLLPKPWTLLLHADGGTGKTAMCQTLAKHLSQGKAFNVHGGMVPVKKSKILWLNGDQNERILRRQFATIGVERGVDVIGEWDMSWYRRFVKIQNKHKYDLVIIDSLDGCNDSNPYEENRREYAMPLKRLARRNGEDFPACTIIVIHHNTKAGQFRGTGAIKAAVDETWNMRKLGMEELMTLQLAFNSRIITVEKSRDDREGQRMIFTLMQDYTYQIGPVPDTDNTVKPNTPGQHTLDMLEVMRITGEPWSASKFVDHETLGGKHRERAIRYGLKKLKDYQLIQECPKPDDAPSLKGRPQVYYRAIGTAVPGFTSKKQFPNTHENVCKKFENDCAGTDLNFDNGLSKKDFVKKPSCTTGAAKAVSAETAPTFDKPDFLQNDFVNKNPSGATEVDFLHDSRVNRVLPPEVVEKHLQDAMDAWDT
jgi:archaellum biogenesis ATPase FlaH